MVRRGLTDGWGEADCCDLGWCRPKGLLHQVKRNERRETRRSFEQGARPEFLSYILNRSHHAPRAAPFCGAR